MSGTKERFSAALHHSARAWRVALNRRLKHLKLSQAGWMTVALVAEARQRMSQIELAHALGVEAATVVSMVDRLVKSGLVLREPSETDRRVKLIVLTDSGRAVYKQVKTQAVAFRAELLSQEDESLLLQATELLERMQANLEKNI
jgi:MarR family transcriptional regulator, transcriptional regulator for hemolysin